MGEISNGHENGKNNKGVVKKSNKAMPRVDMTPVVDLAFLLLTFFMLTTTFIKPQVMDLVLPEDKTEINQPMVNEDRVLSLVPDGNNKLYWFIGITDPEVHETDYSETGIRRLLLEQNKLINKIVVLIKPNRDSTYENLVNILDELEITEVARYALIDITEEDLNILKTYTGKG